MGLIQFMRSILHILSGRPRVPPSLQGNELLSIILKRRSVRRFTDAEIPDDVFAAILEAGRLAPSTVNLQTWSLAVFTPAAWQETFGQPIPFRGQRAVIVLGDVHRDRAIFEAFPDSPLVEYTVAVMNASLAAMNMNIAAEALGVSSVMLSETGRTGLLDAMYLKQQLELPGHVFPLMTMILGYTRASYPPMPPKLPLEQIVFQGKYREADHKVMAEWLEQMKAGYRASHLFAPQGSPSFEAQLQVYASKIGRAEADLRALVFAG